MFSSVIELRGGNTLNGLERAEKPKFLQNSIVIETMVNGILEKAKEKGVFNHIL